MNFEDTWLSRYCTLSPEGCWIWTGKLTPQGYARVPYNWANSQSGHVAVAKMCEIYERGKLVLHTCNVKSCINPHHLYMGTYSDNQRDRVRAGQQNTSHLTEDDVRAIRSIPRWRVDYPELADRYQISPSTVKKIRSKQTWKWVCES